LRVDIARQAPPASGKDRTPVARRIVMLSQARVSLAFSPWTRVQSSGSTPKNRQSVAKSTSRLASRAEPFEQDVSCGNHSTRARLCGPSRVVILAPSGLVRQIDTVRQPTGQVRRLVRTGSGVGRQLVRRPSSDRRCEENPESQTTARPPAERAP